MSPTPLSAIRVLAVDLDKTALDGSGRIAHYTIASLSEAARGGLQVVFVSARPLWSIRALTSAMPTADSAVAAGGAIVVDEDDRLLLRKAIPPEKTSQLASLLGRHAVSALLYRGHETYALGSSEAQRAEIEMTSRLESPPTWQGGSVDKILFFAESHHPIRQEVSRISGLSSSNSHGLLVEVNASGVNKGSALRHLLQVRNWDASALAAIGDGDNDVPMFGLAGHAFCVANGSPAALKAADTVVAGHDDHGVASVAKSWIAARGTRFH